MKIELINYSKKKLNQKKCRKLCQDLFVHFKGNKTVKQKASIYAEVDDLVLVFVNRKQSKILNFKFRNKNQPTDVLSFAPDEKALGLGELILCVPVLEKQALEQKHSFQRELETMIVHGFLHLLGFDHEKSLKDEARMMKMQVMLLKKYC